MVNKAAVVFQHWQNNWQITELFTGLVKAVIIFSNSRGCIRCCWRPQQETGNFLKRVAASIFLSTSILEKIWSSVQLRGYQVSFGLGTARLLPSSFIAEHGRNNCYTSPRLIHLWLFCVVLLGHQHVRKVQKSGQKGELFFPIIIFANCGPAARDPECILAWAFLFCLIHKNTTTIPEGAEIELGVVESWFLHTRLSTKVN